MKKRKLSMIGMALVALLLVMAGCRSTDNGQSAAEGESLSATGTVVLKVNPEIAVEYDEEGLVTRLIGKNDEGEKIVDTYSDYIGKDSGLVLEELIALIDQAGYFIEEVEGEKRQIVLELETGSSLPQENFLEGLAANVQQAVSNIQTEAAVVKVEEPVLNEGEEAAQSKAQGSFKKENKTAKYIGMDRAKEIALNHAGAEASQADWKDAEFDLDNEVPHYELEFDGGPNEYEYTIHAVSGQIIEFEQDIKAEKKKETTKDQMPKEEAIHIALNHAGLTRSEVDFDGVELDNDEERKEWEIEFNHGQWEYDYKIDALNGRILDFEKEFED